MKFSNEYQMRVHSILIAFAVYLAPFSVGMAAEGPTIAGPIGGTDIRSAQLPPAGAYGGMVVLGSPAFDFVDGEGDTLPGLEDARLTKYLAAPFFLYVSQKQVFGGSIGLAGIVPVGSICGRLLTREDASCNGGIGDPYIELQWSRSFGRFRPSSYPGALPVQEGLSAALGLGAVLPLGQFDPASPSVQARSIGTNVLDIAPSIALTYTTPPLIADGTEFSGKLYWNEYFENEQTDYLTGSIVSLDFAASERFGKSQLGLAGSYLKQVQDDMRRGIPVAPDGNRAAALTIGPVFAYDVPEFGAAIKLKFQWTAHAENTVRFWGLSLGVIKKF